MGMKMCKGCEEFPVLNGDRFCPSCGKEYTEMPTCSCGRTLLMQYKFCPSCGAEAGKKKDSKQMEFDWSGGAAI